MNKKLDNTLKFSIIPGVRMKKIADGCYERKLEFSIIYGRRTPMYNIDPVDQKRKCDEEFNRVVSAQNGSHAIPHPAYFVGGRFHGLYMTHEEVVHNGNGTYTPRWSAMKYHNSLLVNLDLEDQPMIEGYLSPSWDGGYLRYETQKVYDMMFD